MAWTRAEIHDATGFDNGDLFRSEQEVRDYFTVANITEMFGECPYTQEQLDEMAEAVIANRWHMALPSDDPLVQELFALYRRYLAAFLECGEDELREVTSRLAEEDFYTLAAAQNAAEEAAWAEARRDPEWPRAGSEEEDEIAEVFRTLLMEAGY